MIMTLNECLGMGMEKPLKIERIGDMFQLLWLESVITEASLMTRNIKLPSIFMNWMCFHCSLGGLWPPSQNRKIFEINKYKSNPDQIVTFRTW